MIVVSTLSQLWAPNAYARMHGYRRLMEILNLCSTLTDIRLISAERECSFQAGNNLD